MSKTAEIPADKLQLYDKLVATKPNVDRKGASMPYTSVNGHMFGFLTKTGTLALRLPTEEREAFLKKYKTTLGEQNAKVLVESVEVPGRKITYGSPNPPPDRVIASLGSYPVRGHDVLRRPWRDV